jgi:hypothetical protein
MPKVRDWEQVYRTARTIGMKATARALGMTYQRLVAELSLSGVAGGDGAPTQKEIAEATQELQRKWDEGRRRSRWDAARIPAAG